MEKSNFNKISVPNIRTLTRFSVPDTGTTVYLIQGHLYNVYLTILNLTKKIIINYYKKVVYLF